MIKFNEIKGIGVFFKLGQNAWRLNKLMEQNVGFVSKHMVTCQFLFVWVWLVVSWVEFNLLCIPEKFHTIAVLFLVDLSVFGVMFLHLYV